MEKLERLKRFLGGIDGFRTTGSSADFRHGFDAGYAPQADFLQVQPEHRATARVADGAREKMF
jgi:hypothetical protein